MTNYENESCWTINKQQNELLPIVTIWYTVNSQIHIYVYMICSLTIQQIWTDKHKKQ
jgi:hypothetical protein